MNVLKKMAIAGAVALALLGTGGVAHADDYVSIMNQGCPCTRWRHFTVTVLAGDVTTWNWNRVRTYEPYYGDDWNLQAHVVVHSGDTLDVTTNNDWQGEGQGMDWGQNSDLWLTDQMYELQDGSTSWGRYQGSWTEFPLDEISLVLDNSQTDDPVDERVTVWYRFAEGDCCNGNYGPY